MVFGNLGDDSATGVAMTRSGATGENQIEGDYLINAQGEDVVAGIRPDQADRAAAERDAGSLRPSSRRSRDRLERHYREMQDVEFTIERGKLWMLQTRDAKRTAQAAVRIAVEMAEEGLITPRAGGAAGDAGAGRLLPPPAVRPRGGAARPSQRASGWRRASTSRPAPRSARSRSTPTPPSAGRSRRAGAVIMVRPETKPDDVHGMLAAQRHPHQPRRPHQPRGARRAPVRQAGGGGRRRASRSTSSSATIAGRRAATLREGDSISIDGTLGEVYAGELPTVVPDIKDPYPPQAARLGRRVSAASRSGPTPTIRSTRGAPAPTARRGSGSAAPSTCSSRPSACRTCSG